MATDKSEPHIEPSAMFRPPLARGMQVLDRSVFHKTVPLKAAQILDNQSILEVRAALRRSKDSLRHNRHELVHLDPDAGMAGMGRKCVLLRPEVKQSVVDETNEHRDDHANNQVTNGTTTPWPYSSTVSELVKQGLISIVPYDLRLNYDCWTYHDIITSILPLDLQTEIPSGFSTVGHVIHINLKDEYLNYKHLIAEVLLDKNPKARTVINKIDDVGEENEFRTFRYEVLGGVEDLNVTVSEENCIFRFDYSKVYYNPRLQTEHRRMVGMFEEGEAVCDVMAGIGPFAVPAGKKNIFVWANDLNPDSYTSLVDAIERNKVGNYVKPSNCDGRSFIRDAARKLFAEETNAKIEKKSSRKESCRRAKEVEKTPIARVLQQPKTFQHFVLNLPASALTFLPSFIGLYPTELRAGLPQDSEMPLIHVYCFSTKDELGNKVSPSHEDDEYEAGHEASGAEEKVCAEITKQLGFPMRPGKIDADGDGAVEVFDVRDVAPKKRMFCASFRLPKEVAFRNP